MSNYLIALALRMYRAIPPKWRQSCGCGYAESCSKWALRMASSYGVYAVPFILALGTHVLGNKGCAMHNSYSCGGCHNQGKISD